jgi:hypothetical protein
LFAGSAIGGAGWGDVRFDNWGFFQRNNNNSNQWKYDPRAYVSYRFENGLTFIQRADLPMIYTNDTGPGNPAGGYSGGLGDAFVEEIFRTPEIVPDFSISASLRVVFPTGRQSPFGDSQYQLAPNVGFTWNLPNVLRGVTIDPHVRYFWGFDPQSGKPKDWPLRYSWAQWSVTLKDVPAGVYETSVAITVHKGRNERSR